MEILEIIEIFEVTAFGSVTSKISFFESLTTVGFQGITSHSKDETELWNYEIFYNSIAQSHLLNG